MPRTLEYMRLEDLRPDSRNPKNHDVSELRESLGRWGYIEPVVVDERTGLLVAGHGRRELLIDDQAAGAAPPEGVEVDADGAWTVPVVRGWSSTDDAEAFGYLVASNSIGPRGGWIEDLLAEGLSLLVDTPSGLAGTGFPPDDLSALLAGLADPPQEQRPSQVAGVDPDDAPDVRPDPISQQGDLWILGDHRLVVGDSTDAETFAVLMGGERANVVWTDPPYGVDYVGKTKEALTIQNDAKEGLRAFLVPVWAAVSPSIAPGSPFYVAGPAGPQGTEMRLSLGDAGWRLHEVLVWVKDVFVLGHSDYHYRHEDILYGWVPGEGRSGRGNHAGSRWQGDNSQDSVFEVPRPKRSTEHPTMKPVELVARQVRNSSLPGEIVLDPFGGSGTTMLAAHRLGRRGFLVEKDPQYADVVCRRFQRFTGIVPLRPSGEPVDFCLPPAA